MNSSNTLFYYEDWQVMSQNKFTPDIEAILEEENIHGLVYWYFDLLAIIRSITSIQNIQAFNKDHGQNGRMDKHKTPNLNLVMQFEEPEQDLHRST